MRGFLTIMRVPCARHSAPRQTHRLGVAALALLSFCAALLAACAPAASSGASPTIPPTTPTATRTPALVFQSDWSKGLAGWNATAGWSIVGGMPQSDGGEGRSVTVPYLAPTGDYAVEYQLQVTPRQAGGRCDFADAPAPSRYGYVVALDPIGLAPQAPSSTALAIYLDPLPPDQFPGGRDYVPGADVRTYRIEVRGPIAKLYVGRTLFASVAAESDRAQTLSGGPFTLTCSDVVGRIASLSIYAL